MPTVTDLQAALNAAVPGDTIHFTGQQPICKTAVHGTATAPITVIGADATAKIRGTGYTAGFGLDVRHNWYRFRDFTIEFCKKGFYVLGGSDGEAHNLLVQDIGDEAFKFRRASRRWKVFDCKAIGTGKSAANGEGFYVSDSSGNWVDLSTPDDSSFIEFRRCTVKTTTNDAFDVKEGGHNVAFFDCVVDFSAGAPAAGAAQGDSGFYLRGNKIDVVRCQVNDNPTTGVSMFQTQEVTVSTIHYGENIKLKAIEAHRNAGAMFESASTGPGIILYSDYVSDANAGGAIIGSDPYTLGDPATYVAPAWTTEKKMAYRSSALAGTSGTNTASSLAVAKPTGTVENDVMVATISPRVTGVGPAPAVTAPGGWELRTQAFTGETAGDHWILVYTRVAGASEPADYTWTFASATRVSGIISTYSGGDTATPVDAVASQANTTASVNCTAPSITTTVANCVLLFMGENGRGLTFTPPSGMTERAEWPAADTARSQEHADAVFATTGATGTRTATLSDSDKSTAALIALRPAPSHSVALSETAGATETVRRSLSYRRDSSHVAGATNTVVLSPSFAVPLSEASPAVEGISLAVSRQLALADVVGAAEALLRRQSANRTVGDTSPASEAVARSLSGPIEQFITVTGSGATASVSLATPKPGTLQLIGYHVDTGSVPAAPAGWTASRAAIATDGPSTCFFYRRTEAGDTGAFSVANPASVAWGLHAWELNGISPGTPFAADSIASASTTVASLTSGGLVVAAGSSVRVFAMLGTSAAFAAGSVAFTDFTKQAEASDTRSASGRRYNPPEGTLTTTASWTNGRRAALTLIAFNTSTAHAAAFENAASADDAITRAVVGGRPLQEAAAATDRLVRAAVTSRSVGEAAAAAEMLVAGLFRVRDLSEAAPSSATLDYLKTILRSFAESAGGTDRLARSAATSRSMAETTAAAEVLARALSYPRSLGDSAAAVEALTRSLTPARTFVEFAPASYSIFALRVGDQTNFVNPLAVLLDRSATRVELDPSRTSVRLLPTDPP